MPESDFQLNFAGIFRGRVLSVVGNVVRVRLESGHVPQEINATLLSPFGGKVPAPPIDATGIVLVQGISGVWLGVQADVGNEQEPPPAGVQFNTQDNLSTLRISKDEMLISNTAFRASSNLNRLDIKQGKSEVSLSDTRLQLKLNGEEAGALFGTDLIQLENKKTLNLVGGDKLNLCSRGNIIMSGGIYSTTETDEFRSLNAAGKIIGKAGEIKFGAGGMFSIDAGKLNINLTSSAITGGQVPGTGGLDAFTINVVQGNTLVSSALGNIEMYAMGLPNYVRMKAGAVFDLIYSQMQLTRAKATIENVLSPAVYSALDLKFGDANLMAMKNVNIDAIMKTTITGKTGIKLDALTSIDIAALLNITIDGKVKIEIKTAMLDLKNAKMITAGPKTVAPTGSGPFCAVPTCAFAGIPHVGPTAVG